MEEAIVVALHQAVIIVLAVPVFHVQAAEAFRAVAVPVAVPVVVHAAAVPVVAVQEAVRAEVHAVEKLQ